jgi:hypothetical protein
MQPALNQVKRKFYSPINNDHSPRRGKKPLAMPSRSEKKEKHAALFIYASYFFHARDFEVAPQKVVLISEMENA